MAAAPDGGQVEERISERTEKRRRSSDVRHPTMRSECSVAHMAVAAEESLGHWRPTLGQVLRRSGSILVEGPRPQASLPATESQSDLSSAAGSSEHIQAPEGALGCAGCCARSGLKPQTQAWLSDRLGNRDKAILLVVFMLLNSVRFVMQEEVYRREENPFSGLAIAHLGSMLFALILSVSWHGREMLPKVLCWHTFWRLFVMAVFFTMATFLTIRAYRTGLLAVIVLLLGYAFLPISVFLSSCMLRRQYGKLEWLASTMVVLAVVALLLLRERCHLAHCGHLELWSPERDVNALGIFFVLLGVLFSVVASLLSERLYKNQSLGLIRNCTHEHTLPVMKAQLDLASAALYGAFWAVSLTSWGPSITGTTATSGVFELSPGHAVFVLVAAAQSWLAALVTKHFNTVVRSLVQTLCTALSICLSDPLRHDKWHFSRRGLATLSMAGIVLASSLVFQTGRINLSMIKRRFNLVAPPEPSPKGLGWRDFWASIFTMPKSKASLSPAEHHHREESRTPSQESRTPSQASETSSMKERVLARFPCLALLEDFSCIILYVLADGLRTVLQSVALRETQNTPAVFVLVINACGLMLANGLTLKYNRCPGMRQAWDLREVARFLLCGFFFALTSTLQALAYALGISPALCMVIGKFYTPMLAILGRYILNKFFCSLEWLTIAILTLANLAYGGIETMAEAAKSGDSRGLWAQLVPALCVLGSAVSCCVNTLLMERLTKSKELLPDGNDVPFHMQKVRLDAGTVMWAAAFLPAMGLIAQGPDSEKFAFWKERPLTHTCGMQGFCEDGVFVPQEQGTDFGHCACGQGFFVGWGTPSIPLALVVNVFHSWVTGVVVKRFSSIYRAIADAFGVPLVYFVLQPLFMGGGHNDVALHIMAVLIPVSALTFSFSANEMKRAMELLPPVKETPKSEDDCQVEEPCSVEEDGPDGLPLPRTADNGLVWI